MTTIDDGRTNLYITAYAAEEYIVSAVRYDSDGKPMSGKGMIGFDTLKEALENVPYRYVAVLTETNKTICDSTTGETVLIFASGTTKRHDVIFAARAMSGAI